MKQSVISSACPEKTKVRNKCPAETWSLCLQVKRKKVQTVVGRDIILEDTHSHRYINWSSSWRGSLVCMQATRVSGKQLLSCLSIWIDNDLFLFFEDDFFLNSILLSCPLIPLVMPCMPFSLSCIFRLRLTLSEKINMVINMQFGVFFSSSQKDRLSFCVLSVFESKWAERRVTENSSKFVTTDFSAFDLWKHSLKV